MIESFHFLRPWWFLALIPAIILSLQIFKISFRNNNIWAKYCDPHLLQHLLVGQQSAKNYWLAILLFISWLLAITALAGPTWSKYANPVYHKNIARVIALDVSQSMNATDISPSRLARAKYKLLDILAAIKEGQTGMLVFSSQPFVVSPLTSDSNTIASMIPAIDTSIVPVQGSNISAALSKSAQLMQQAGFNQGNIILITDSKPDSKDFSEASQLAKQGFNTNVIAIGSEQGGPIKDQDGNLRTDDKGNIIFANTDFNALQELARNGGGNYFPFSNQNSDLNQILDNIQLNQHRSLPSQNQETQSLWKDEGYWLIWLLILFSALLVRKGWLDKLC